MNYSNRVNRIRGQVNGIARMIEADKDCTEIVQQILAVRSAITKLGIQLLKEECKECSSNKDVEKLNNTIEKLFYLT